jgi:flagellar L-ring protein precursor FlgH
MFHRHTINGQKPGLASSIFASISMFLIVGSHATAQDGSLFHRNPTTYQLGPSSGDASRGVPIPTSANRAGGPTARGGMVPQPMPNNVQPGLTMAQASWIYQPPSAMRTYQRNDKVTIRVDEISRVRAEGNSESRRNSLYDALLKDWLQFDGWDSIKPAQQEDGDPRVQGSINQLYRADASLESRESITFNIAARIVDVRPNGDLVLEASKDIVVNENIFETSLSGICRPADIAADNVVLSRDIVNLRIHKRERGRLRDGYKRGWFTRWFETLAPF